jgi:cbb3-type cytochrome oxidase subunit 3
MAGESTLRTGLNFLNDIGVYDVILPFLLVFTFVFAILEKTKILGYDSEAKTTKKNLNAISAFVVALLVVASVRLVSIINEVMANVVILVVLGITFMMTVGTYMADKEFSLDPEKNKKWVIFFMIFSFIAIVIIFLNALGWMGAIEKFFSGFGADAIYVILFILAFIGIIFWIVNGNDKKGGNP